MIFLYMLLLTLFSCGFSSGETCEVTYILPKDFKGPVVIFFSSNPNLKETSPVYKVDSLGLVFSASVPIDKPCEILFLEDLENGGYDTLNYYVSPQAMYELDFGVCLHEKGGTERNGLVFQFQSFIVTDKSQSETNARKRDFLVQKGVNILTKKN